MSQKLDPGFQNLDSEQKKRLWEMTVHDDTMFNNRLNFFLVFESVLLSVVGLLYSSKFTPAKIVLIMIICLGIVLTILWGYIQARQRHVYESLASLCREVFPEYKMARAQIGKWPLSAVMLLTYIVPALVLLIWIILLVSLIIT
jgi:hypothetical protein